MEQKEIIYQQITDPVLEDTLLAPIDRAGTEPQSEDQLSWRARGVVVKPKLLPNSLIDAYSDAWLRSHSKGQSTNFGGGSLPRLTCTCPSSETFRSMTPSWRY